MNGEQRSELSKETRLHSDNVKSTYPYYNVMQIKTQIHPAYKYIQLLYYRLIFTLFTIY